MKSALILPLFLLLAGCNSPQHSYYTAERSHIQRDQIIAESNRFPTPGNRDTYYWYQKGALRNMSDGHNVSGDYNYYGSQAQNYGSSYYAPYW
jgi:hypothetical protein